MVDDLNIGKHLSVSWPFLLDTLQRPREMLLSHFLVFLLGVAAGYIPLQSVQYYSYLCVSQ